MVDTATRKTKWSVSKEIARREGIPAGKTLKQAADRVYREVVRTFEARYGLYTQERLKALRDERRAARVCLTHADQCPDDCAHWRTYQADDGVKRGRKYQQIAQEISDEQRLRTVEDGKTRITGPEELDKDRMLTGHEGAVERNTTDGFAVA